MPDSKKYDRQHFSDVTRYGRQIEAIYRTAVREAAAIGSTVSPLDPAKPFVFKDYPQTTHRLNSLLSKMQRDIQTVVVNGINASWSLSNNKNSELANWVFGKAAKSLPEAIARQYYNTNEPARQAFLARKVGGLSLSEKVWRYAEQFKVEIEMGLDIGIRDGLGAEEMARDLRQYLQQPDNLFRRVRSEHGQLHLSKRAAAYSPGPGVYRSSHKNAVRLARTETNMAYRTADHERWQQLAFVVGQRVSLSGSHPVFDICDLLAGDYPKDFVFTGWHPNCFCIVTPILKTTEELKEETRRILAGEKPDTRSKNEMVGVPAQFAQWVRDNEGRINRARERGILPYFLRDNGSYLKPIEASLSVLERAAARHAARTPQQVDAIRSEWYERRAIRHYGQNMLGYMDGISDVDTTALSDALNGGDVSIILAEARKLKTTGKEILALTRLDNPIEVAREFSMEKAAMVNVSVEKKLAGWANLSLEDRQKKLLFEIQWVETNQKYSTWRTAQRAYQKELAAVEDAIDWKKIGDELSTASDFKTKSAPYKNLVAELKGAISAKNKAQAQDTIAAIKAKRDYLEKEVARRESKKLLGDGTYSVFADDAFAQARKDKAIWCKTTQTSMAKFNDAANKVYGAATKVETDAAYRYTTGSGYVNRPLRGYDNGWYNFKGIGKVPLNNESPDGPMHIEALTKLIGKSTYDKDIWLQRGIENTGLVRFLQLSDLNEQAVQALVGKTFTDPAFLSCGAAKGSGFGGNILNIYCPKGTKMLYIDGRSSYASENEMLIQRSTRYRITKVERVSSRYYIDIEIVGQI